MKEIKKNLSKWMYWFLLGVAIILVYKFLDNFTVISNTIGNFLDIIAPFLLGTLIAYLLYIPASRIERGFKKSKVKFINKKAKGISVLITYILAVLLIILLPSTDSTPASPNSLLINVIRISCSCFTSPP